MKVSYLGGRAENYAEWNKVYSEKGGMYEMTIQYVPHADRKLEIRVNNEKSILLKDLAGTDGQQLASVTVQVRLKPGNNGKPLLLGTRYRLLYSEENRIIGFIQ